MDKLKYWIALNHFSKFGPRRFQKLLKYFSNDLQRAWESSCTPLQKAGIEENIALEFIAWREKINPNQLLEKIEQEKIKIITILDKNYPQILKEIYNPPQLLYYQGNIDLNNSFSIAVVGTRKYTSYGQQATEKITKALAQNKLTIISGLALGIDTFAHEATLETGGQTVAVLGSGLDRQSLYPPQNRYLANKIILGGGAIISEFPPETPPLKHHFPQRNRLISGLSLGTLVIEAGEKSGALITANYALEQNREVFAVPGNIFSPASKGPNNIIKMGAKPVASAEDLIETLNLSHAPQIIENKKIIGETKEEKKIISHLSHEPCYVDEIVRLTKLDTNVINSTLTIMEMKGMVKNLGNMQYVIAH